VSIAGQVYLVTTVTKARARIFNDLQCGRLLVHALRRQHEAGTVESLAFVVMPDHLHWLFALSSSASLSKVMGSIKRLSAQEINRLKRTPGQPGWQDGFHDHALRREEDLKAVARYIVANPIRARLVQRVGDYPLWDACWI
jgi:putative transposase